MEDTTAVDDGVDEKVAAEAPSQTEEDLPGDDEAEEGPKETTEDETDESGESEESDESDEEIPEEIEFDFGGNKLRVAKDSIPEEVAAEVDKFTKGLWADYTKKSQTASETLKSVEAREQAVSKFEKMHGETLDTYSQGLRIKAELEQLDSVNLSEMWQSDPDRARQISDLKSIKQAEFNDIVNKVSTQESELTKAQEAEYSRRIDEGKQLVERRIKGFKESEIVEYAVKSGVKESEAKKWPLNPIVTEWAHKAMLYDRAQAGAKTPTKPAPKPVTPMKAKGKTSSPLDLVRDAEKFSADDWAKKRNEQLRKRGKI